MKELSRLLGAQPYFAGDELTLADLMLGPQLATLATTPEWQPLSASTGNLAAWVARMNARPSFQATTWERLTEVAKAA
jgi:glutathione S-transferase